MIISPYTPDVVRPQYEAFKYNTDLIGKVLLYKQAAYDDAYKNIQNLRQQALNINFLNEKEQGKIDHFNNQVNEFFSKTQEFGDLSDPNISGRYAKIFNIIGKDPELIQRYRQDKKYQQMLMDVENKKNAKDPRKEGFHPINYGNFLSRIQEYSETDLDKDTYEVRPYNNYVDYNTEIAKLVKNVPIKKFTQDIPTGDGRIQTITRVGRDPNEVRRVVSDYMQSNGVTQLREEAEFELRNNQSIEGKAGLYNNYTGYINQQKQILNTQLDAVKARQKTAKPTELADLAQQQALIETKLSDIDLSQYSPQGFYDRDQDQIIGDLTNVRLYNGVDNLTNAYGGFAESRTFKADSAWLQLARLNQSAAVTQAKLALEQAKLANEISKNGAGVPVNPSSALTPDGISISQPTTQDYGSVFSSVESSLMKLEAQDVNIFASGIQSNGEQIRTERQVAEDLLRNPNSLDKNEMYSGSPWIQAFKLARLEAMRKYDTIDDTTVPLMLEEILPEVNRIVNNPQTAAEVKINRELQDIRANKESVKSFLTEANESGDPVAYVKARPNIYTYASGMKVLDKTGVTGDRAKSIEAANLAMFNVVQNHIGNVNPIGDGNQIISVDRKWMKHAQIFDNGLVRVWLDPDLFKDESDDDKDGELVGGYFAIDGKEQRPTIEKPYIEFTDPQMMKVNWSKHLGLRLTDKPQKRWGWSADQKSLPFEIRMVDNGIQFAINGGTFKDADTSNPELALERIYQIISQSQSTEFNQQ